MSVRKSIRKLQNAENDEIHCKHCTFKDFYDNIFV